MKQSRCHILQYLNDCQLLLYEVLRVSSSQKTLMRWKDSILSIFTVCTSAPGSLIKTSQRILLLSFDTSVFIYRNQTQGKTCAKKKSFVLRDLPLMPRFSCKRKKQKKNLLPHLTRVCWNNSKCLSCIVWHAVWEAIKPFFQCLKRLLIKYSRITPLP